MANSNAYAYTVTEIDPTYSTDFVLGIFVSLEAAETARKEATARLDVVPAARGVYHSVTAYQIGKLYH